MDSTKYVGMDVYTETTSIRRDQFRRHGGPDWVRHTQSSSPVNMRDSGLRKAIALIFTQERFLKWFLICNYSLELIGIDWRHQRTLRIVHFGSAQALADALGRAGALTGNDQKRAMVAELDSEKTYSVLRDVVLTGEQGVTL